MRRLASPVFVAFALFATAVPEAVAQPPSPEPEELWRQFPLESERSNAQVSTNRESAPRVSTPTTGTTAEGGRDGSVESVLIAAIVLASALVFMLTTGALAYAARGPVALRAVRRLRPSWLQFPKVLALAARANTAEPERKTSRARPKLGSPRIHALKERLSKHSVSAERNSPTLTEDLDTEPVHGMSAARAETATPTQEDELQALKPERETLRRAESEESSGEGAASVKDQMRGGQADGKLVDPAPPSPPGPRGFASPGGRLASEQGLPAAIPDNVAAASVTRTDQLVPRGDARVVPTLVDYLQVLRRRGWMFLVPVVLVPVVAVALSLRQGPAYRASAEVLLKPATATDSQPSDPTRAAQTAAELARVPEVARRAVRAGRGPNLTPFEFLQSSSVSSAVGSDILTFSVTDSDPGVAMRLGTAYARAFSAYRHELETQQLKRAQAAIGRQLRELEAAGLKGSEQYRILVRTDRELTARAFDPPTAVVVQEADRARKVGPTTVRNGAIALVLGLVLGLALAFLWDALDTRVRSVETLRDGLGLRLLGRLPSPRRRLRETDRLVMLAAPLSHEAEPFRVLRASFDYANADYQARTIMVTSAVRGEGKSTTVANLAVALARAGRRVVLIDSDLRRPSLHRLFDVAERPGLIDVELGHVELEQALQPIAVTHADATVVNGRRPVRRRRGALELLAAGQAFQAPDELGVELTVAGIATSLQGHADLVLIDAAPLLPVGDAITLSAHVDALVLVVRHNSLPSSTFDDLRRTLASTPAQKLGFILTGADAGASYPHFYRYSPGRPAVRVDRLLGTRKKFVDLQ